MRKSGTLKTVPIALTEPANTLQVTVNASGGQLRAQIIDADTGQALPGLTFSDCEPITVDSLRAPVHWRKGDLSAAAGKHIQVEFEIIKADVFAFEFIQ